MTTPQSLPCVLPWKAFFVDERCGVLSALPCCANWFKGSFGLITSNSTVADLWNSPDAQELRRRVASGNTDDLCARDCPWLVSGRFSESAMTILPGPEPFEENQRLNLQEIRERRTILKSKPMAVRMIPTLRCNIRCRMCHQDHGADLELPETFSRSVRELGPFIYDYQLHGGEVLLARRLRQWIEPDWFAANPQMLLSLITNGTVLPPSTWDILQNVRINYITISINAATRETYERMAGSDLFENVIRNAVAIRNLGRNHNLRKFETYVSFVITRSNFHEVPDFVRLAARLEMPFRLLLVVGDEMGESIFTAPPILDRVFDAVNEAELIADERSRSEVTRVRCSLQESLSSSEHCRETP